MPTLRQLQCNVEWIGRFAWETRNIHLCVTERLLKGTENPLLEYNTIYKDGKVETYIAVPEIPTPFAVRLRSMGWIASGLAMVRVLFKYSPITGLLIII